MKRIRVIALVCAALIYAAPAAALDQDAKDNGLIDCSAVHLSANNPNLAKSRGEVICFEAYVSDFNTGTAKSGKKSLHVAVPHWVAHRIKRANSAPESNDRPDSWFTVPALFRDRIAAADQSYAFSEKYRLKHKNWYERGHLAQKYLAERVSKDAAWFTHNTANAVPQRGRFNKGHWLTLECYTGAWANKYGEVWVVTGPVLPKGKRVTWLRSDKNKKAVPVAIPPSMFKIVVRKDGGTLQTLSFIEPQTHKSYSKKAPYDPAVWFKSIAEIERLTGGEFMSELSAAAKQAEPTKLWPVAKTDFDEGCKSQRADVL